MQKPTRTMLGMVLSFVLAMQTVPTASAERFGILIGIDKYAKLPIGEQLRGCVNDVDLVKQMLRSDQTFKPEHLVVLTNAMATRDAILGAMKTTLKRVRDCNASGESAQVIFHFSGHGSQVMDQLQGPLRDEPSYFDQTIVPHDASRLGGEQDIRDDDLRSWAVDITSDPANRLLVVLDCCHSGTGLRGDATRFRRLDRPLSPPVVKQFAPVATEAELPTNAGFISACRADQLEPETESAGRPHGLLTLSLARVSALSRGPENSDGKSSLPMTRLADLLRWQYQLEDHLGLLPEPQIEISGSMAGEVFWLAGVEQSSDANGQLELAVVKLDDDKKKDDDKLMAWGTLQRGIVDSIQIGSSFSVLTLDDSQGDAGQPQESLKTIGTATVKQVGFDRSRVSLRWNQDAPRTRPPSVLARVETRFQSMSNAQTDPNMSRGDIVAERLTQLVTQHVAKNAESSSAIRAQLVIGKRDQPNGNKILWEPATEQFSARPSLGIGDIYAVEVQHDAASEEDLFATIIHIDPKNEISLMCPRSFAESNIKQQRIDGTKGVRSSGYICNGDAELPQDDPEYQPPITGLHRAVVLVSTRPIDLSSMFHFLNAGDKPLMRGASAQSIAIDFFQAKTRGLQDAKSNTDKDKIWWDAQLVQWISR